MNAMVLAAGRGTRLAPLGLQAPKILVDIAGEPLLMRQLRYLARERIDRVVVNTHYLAEQVERFAATYGGPCDLRLVTEPNLLGTAGGVRNALPLLGDAPFVVLYGDVLTDASLAPLVSAHRLSDADATLAVYPSNETEAKGIVETASDGFVTGFVEKGSVTGEALVNAGIYLLSPDFVATIPKGVVADFGHDVFPAALREGRRLFAFELSAPVIDVGTPDTLRTAQDTFSA